MKILDYSGVSWISYVSLNTYLKYIYNLANNYYYLINNKLIMQEVIV